MKAVSRKMKLSTDVNLTEVSHMTSHYTAADYRQLFQSAGIRALRQHPELRQITQQDLIAVVERMQDTESLI